MSATRTPRRLALVVALVLAMAACGGDDDGGSADPSREDDGGSEETTSDDESAADADGTVVAVEPEGITGFGPEAAVGQPIDFDGLVVTVTAVAGGDAEPIIPTADGVVDVGLEVDNTSSEEGYVPSPSVLCEALEAGAGPVHASDLLVEPIAAGGSVSGEVTLDVPGDCEGAALVITRVQSGSADEGPPTAHVLIPEDARP